MDKSLKIERIPYEEPHHINLVVTASNGKSNGQIEIYDNADFLNKIADSLEKFPVDSKDEFKWELGSEKPEDRFAFYFLFKVFNYMTEGWISAIHIRFNNNEKLPFREISDFCIPCEPAGINRLGKLFREFAKLDSKMIIWNGIEGKIIK
jgi:hypothetical protein